MKINSVTTKFNIEQIVYLRIDPDNAGMIAAITIGPSNTIFYSINWADHESSEHGEFELTDEKGFST